MTDTSRPEVPGGTRARMPAEERRSALLAHANAMLLAQSYFPIPFEELARRASVSKGLVYAYFATQADLANAMLAATLARFDRDAFDAACASGDTVAIITTGARLYFRIVETDGPLLHLLLNDRYLTGQLDPALTDYIAACRRRAIRALGDYPGLAPRDAGAALELFLAITEDAGRAAFRGEMDPERALAISRDLIVSGIAALAPADPI